MFYIHKSLSTQTPLHEAAGMAQHVRALTPVLAENCSSVPGTHIWQLTTPATPALVDRTPSLISVDIQTCVHAHRHTDA